MKVFIVQPQCGKTELQLQTDREAARVALNDFYSGDEYEVMEIPKKGDLEKPLEFLGRCLAEMAKADCIFYRSGSEVDQICTCLNFCGAMFGKKGTFL